MNDIPKFKIFLSKLGLYKSADLTPNLNADFISGLQKLEQYIDKQLNTSTIGLIWDGKEITTSLEEVSNVLDLIKKAQATVDTFNLEEYEHNPPMGLKPNPTGEDYEIETGDPYNSQQTGKLQQEIPTNIPEGDNQNDRLDALKRLLKQLSVPPISL